MDRDYELFVRVVEAGSLSAAGRELQLSPAMVSKRMARLEGRLNVRLAHRTTRRLVTTDVGQRFYEDVVAILASAHDAEARASGGQEPAGRLRISAPTSFGRLHVAPHVHRFITAHPRVAIELDLSDSFVDLIGERTDLAIRITQEVAPHLEAHRLATNRRILCAAPTYLDQHGAPQALADLSSHRLLAASEQLPWRIEGPQGLTIVEAQSAVRTNSSEVVRELALTGMGIALRSTWDIAEELSQGRLQRILSDHEGSTDVAIYAVYPRAALPPPAVTAFISMLRSLYGVVPPWDRAAV
jgi:DNA-binding transcriptional LysR family regulator